MNLIHHMQGLRRKKIDRWQHKLQKNYYASQFGEHRVPDEARPCRQTIGAVD